MVNWPGIAEIAAAGAALLFFRLYLGVTETTAGSRPAAMRSGTAVGAGVGVGGAAVFHAGFVGGLDGAVAAGCSEPSSAEFSEWMRHAIVPTISRITPKAAAIEYANSLGGVFLISVTAFRATSRGCTLGFSG